MTIMKSGDFVSIDYVGRLKESGEVFDVTMEDVAKKNNVFNQGVSYNPVFVVVGGDFTIKGLDEALQEMKVGDKKTVVVEPEKGFGPRMPKLVRPMPLSNFKDQEIDPTPGAWININGIRGKILSSDGGRIRVDFNHPLAGKVLEYEVEVKSQITDTTEQVKAVASFMTGVDIKDISAKITGKDAELSIGGKELQAPQKKKIAELTVKWVGPVEKIKFVEEFDGKPSPEAEAGAEHSHEHDHAGHDHAGHDHSSHDHKE